MIGLTLAAIIYSNTMGGPPADLQVILQAPTMNSTWKVGQPVKLVGGFRNSSRAPVWLDGRLAYKVHLWLQVTDKNGNYVEYPGSRTKIRLAPPAKDDFVKLAGGKMLLDTDIANGDLIFKKPGIYTISLNGSHGGSEYYAKSFGIKLGSIGKRVQVIIRVVR